MKDPWEQSGARWRKSHHVGELTHCGAGTWLEKMLVWMQTVIAVSIFPLELRYALLLYLY